MSILALAVAVVGCGGTSPGRHADAARCEPPRSAPTTNGVMGAARGTTAPRFDRVTDSMSLALGLQPLRQGCSPNVLREVRVWTGFGLAIPDVFLLRLTQSEDDVIGMLALAWRTSPDPSPSDALRMADVEVEFRALFGCDDPTTAFGRERMCVASFERTPDWRQVLDQLDSLGIWTAPTPESFGSDGPMTIDGAAISVELRGAGGYRTYTWDRGQIDYLDGGAAVERIWDRVNHVIAAATRPDVLTRGPVVSPAGPRPLLDRGVGIVHFARFPDDDASGNRADTIPIHREPRADAEVMARFILRTDSMNWGFELEVEPSLAPNLLEFGYEDVGLPADSAPRGDGWVRVVHGFATDSTPRTGWARLAPDDIVYRPWSEILPENVLFFVNDADIAFRGAPEGEPVAFPLDARGTGADRRLDYILHALEARGDWLRVRAVTPSDYCAEPEQPRDTTLWIRYLDDRGRPHVWYHTRGC